MALSKIRSESVDLADDFAGMHFGGTGSSNQFDDYETGTFTPTATPGTGSYGTGPTTASGYYTKIGDICHIRIILTLGTQGTASGGLTVGGLPFTHGIASRMPILFRENAATGYIGQYAVESSSTSGFIQYYEGTTTNANATGRTYLIAGAYQTV